jgi:acyl-CoA synthetase (AMP-forming)/AMP-acid ligase II/alpha-ketoglutarate-dependent taurine dioxygenase
MERAFEFARSLAGSGVERGQVCAIIVRHHPDFHPLYLAVELVGALPAVLAYPNDYLHPDKLRQGLAGMARHSGLDWLLTESALDPLVRPLALGDHATLRGVLHPLDGLAASPSVRFEPVMPRPDDPCLVQHSSGTTGLQKAVRLSHAAVLRHLMQYGRAIALVPEDRVVSWLPLYHDMGLIAAFHLPLAFGVPTVQLNPFEWIQAPALFLDTLSREGGTIGWLPNFAYNLMATRVRDEELDGIRLDQVRLLVNCSEPVRADSQEIFAARFAPYGLRPEALGACYAMAETTFAITQTPPGERAGVLHAARDELRAGSFRPAAPGEEARAVVSSGSLIGGCALRVIDETGADLPDGKVGELVVRSESMFDGYHNAPERTREVLRDGWYRSGDCGFRWHGQVYVTGRKNDLIIVVGKNLYPEDIEDAVGGIEGVIPGRVVAFGVDEAAMGTQQVWVAAETELEGETAHNSLREAIHRAGMAIDVTISTVRLLPPRWLIKSSAGKLSRSTNRERLLANMPMPGATCQDPPATETEAQIARLWGELLGGREVSRQDNFLETGGNSILGTQLISRLRQLFAVEVPLPWLFESPTIAELARRIETAPQAASACQIPPIQPLPRSGEVPLSFAQQRLWFVDQMDPGLSAYNMPMAVRITGPLDVAAVQDSLSRLIQRHETLRTTFPASEGRPRQAIAPTVTLSWTQVDLRQIAKEQREVEARRMCVQEARQPFDLTRGPLLRARLLQLGEQQYELLLTIHHIISDGWSMGILSRELGTLYADTVQEQPSPLPELPIQYADFAEWQRNWLQGGVLDQQLSYWRRRLEGAPVMLELPTDFPRPAVQSFRGARHSLRLSGELTTSLEQLSLREGVTLFMTLLAAFQTLLSRYTGQDDIVVGTDLAGRSRVELEPLIGFFVNHAVLRTHLDDNPPFRQLLQRVREITLAAYAHQDLPFDRLVDALKPERCLSHHPLFQVLLVFQNATSPPLVLPGLVVHPVPIEDTSSKFDLALFVEQNPAGLECSWGYRTDLFQPATIARCARQFETLLASVVAAPETRLRALEIRSDTEKEQESMQEQELQQSQLSRLRSARRKSVALAGMTAVRTGLLHPEQRLPLVIEPEREALDVADWARCHVEWIERQLLTHGGLLFRGFDTPSIAAFEQFALALCPELFGEYGDLPRAGAGGKIYTSTPYPPDQAIHFHNESSHLHSWPLRIWFYCVQAAPKGGETPLVDCRDVYQRLDPSIREPFACKGVMYVRNYSDSLDVSWERFFQTSNRREVEEFCRQAGIGYEWTGEDGLRTRQVRPAVAAHPQTGEMLFFNQIMLHHVACLEPEVRASLEAVFAPEELPRQVFYGDGTPIEDRVMLEVEAVYAACAARFQWQKGDIVMLDNMLTAHGRSPYEVPRKIVVAMGAMTGLEKS